ncbi:MAG: TonB-dependent receptor [Acidobacteriota bacterium]|nr:TonB-dependent receptor [Acidobacteriota bacterium]
MKRYYFRAILSVLVIFWLLPFAASGQTERGSIVGIVTDNNGAAVSNAAVTVTDLGNKTTQTFTTNSEGIYNVPFLTPGNYEISATAPGFSKTVVSDVVVSVGTRSSVNIALKIGEITETVTVEDAAPLVQTENASIGQVITSQQLTDLPSANRNVYSFLSLDSTVTGQGVNSSNAEAFRLESGGTMSVGGSRPSSVTFKIDGQANNDPTFGTPTVTPSLDAVKEFQLQNNAYSAEFEGFTQVNVATKSGTNRFHGSLFEFVQNDFFQPRNPLAPLDSEGRRGKNKLRFNQFGGTVGGPLWVPNFGEGGPVFSKESTFFFFSYEGLRNNGRGTGFARVLTQAERRGDFSANLGACITVGGNPVPQLNPNGTPSGNCIRTGQIFDPTTTVANPLFNPNQAQSAFNPQFIRQPFANNQIPANRLDPRAQAFINAVQPLPNFTSASDLNYAGPTGSNFLNNQYSIRIDHRISDNDSVYGRLTWQNNQRDTEAVLPYQAVDLRGLGRVFNSSWTHIFSPSLVNEFRFGYIRGVYGQSVSDIDPTQFGVNNTSLNTIPGLILTAGGTLSYGGFTGSILETTQNTYQIADNLSLTRGVHSIKFGFKADRNRFNNIERGASGGSLSFNGLFSVGNSSLGSTAARPNSIADFLLGNISSQSLNVPNPALLRNTPWAVYAQDDWKFNPQLTINLGLRYELHQPWSDERLGGRMVDLTGEGRLLVRDPEVARLANSPLVVCCTSPQVVETDKNDFAPRIGIAYRPFKSDNMVIRAGYGMFYTDTNQFYHWLYYAPLRSGTFSPRAASFQSPAATLSDPFPIGNFTPPGGSGIFIGTPSGVNPAALNNQPVISISALGPYKTPQSQQWSIGVQREIVKNMVLDVSYKGSVTRNLPVQWFFNQPTFSSTPVNFQSLDPAANPYLRRPYENFSITSNIVANVLEAEYNALTVKVDKRFSNGYGFLSTYTWSRSIDQGAETGSLGQNHAFLPNNRDFDAGRGVSILDIPHRWVTSGNVDLPFGRGRRFLNQGGIVNALLGGWRLSGIFQIQSGQPFSPYLLTSTGRTNTGVLVVERGNFGNTTPYTRDEWRAALEAWRNGSRLYIIRPDAIDLNYTGVGNIPRNAFRYLHTRRLDLSLAKVTSFGERAKLELRFDMFNVTREILHHPVFHTQVAGANALTNPIRGSIPGRNIYFLPHTIQVGARFTF